MLTPDSHTPKKQESILCLHLRGPQPTCAGESTSKADPVQWPAGRQLPPSQLKKEKGQSGTEAGTAHSPHATREAGPVVHIPA